MSKFHVSGSLIAFTAALMLLSIQVQAQDATAPKATGVKIAPPKSTAGDAAAKAKTADPEKIAAATPSAEKEAAEKKTDTAPDTQNKALASEPAAAETPAAVEKNADETAAEAAAEATASQETNDNAIEMATATPSTATAEDGDATTGKVANEKTDEKNTAGPAAKVKNSTTTAENAQADTATGSQSALVQDVQNVDIVEPAEATDNFTAKSIPRTDREINILTTQTVRHGAMTLTIDHRAYETFLSGEDAWFDYLGLDANNLKVGIGLRLGLKDYMDVGFYRLNNGVEKFDVYEFDTKMRFLEQETGFVNLSLRIGVTWFVQKNAQDSSGFFSQFNVDRRLFGTLLLGTGFAFHTNSTNEEKLYKDTDQSAAVLGYIEWRPVRVFSLNAEMAAAVAGYHSKYPVLAFSARFLTNRHSFQVVVANTQYMSADGLVTNTPRGFDNLVFGFQIVREFQLLKE